MDTDDLSKEAYEAIIIEAERFSHDLTLHFGLGGIPDSIYCDGNGWRVDCYRAELELSLKTRLNDTAFSPTLCPS